MDEYIERKRAIVDACNSLELYPSEYAKLEDALNKIPAADVAPVQKWISVEDRLPEPEQEVLVCCKTQISTSKYVCCAFYIPENWCRESSQFSWDYECCDEYDEEQDDYIVNQGWYESIHNWDEYSAIGIVDSVTHWMPLKEPTKEDKNCKES